jgi:hypothetical protein
MTERRYTEDEAAAVFKRAAEAQQTARRPLTSGEGMTLDDLQEIGREVGIPPALIAQSARVLDREGRPSSRTFLGLPLGVGRTIELGRRLTDEEWEHLVVDLRETFDARGTVRQDGGFRQWTNGNLQALLEPTPDGHRLRLRTLNGNARALMALGLAALATCGAMALTFALNGRPFDADAMTGIGFLSIIGLGAFSSGALRLPGWARLRRRQMEDVAARLGLAASSPEDESRAP